MLNDPAVERAVDEVLAESFPASDPPPWTTGIVRPDPVGRVAQSRPRHPIAASTWPLPQRSYVVGTRRPGGGHRTLIDALASQAAACGLVFLVPVVVLAVGVPIALLARGLVEAVGWLFGFAVS